VRATAAGALLTAPAVRPRDELLELECDVLVPGARPDSIGANVARRLRCAAVAPGANIPYGSGALEILHERSIVACRISPVLPQVFEAGGRQ
jgi:glutamate dehydrogenase/leucine dehydrogenase